MFREEGQAIGYTYLALPGGPDGALKAQSEAYKSVATTGEAGHALWKKQDSGMQFKKGTWNTVSLRVQLNTPGSGNGVFALTINGATRSVPVRFRSSASTKINNLVIVSFFGGGSREWAAPKDSYSLYKDVRVAVW